jgi:hypothetical protein
LGFLERPEEVTAMIMKFMESYKALMHDHPNEALKKDNVDELLKRISKIHDNIFDIINNRKNLAIAELDKHKSSEWIEEEVDSLITSSWLLMNEEINRFLLCR